ncbi:hypothetical protein BDY21DRAFT_367378 [Lineolata rhizophorae]|uniref:BRCT domain-containing protein n=1 Tax=Lineolata rhizophorae TaxID=578093 RepID=A0A6A6NMS8_9PEZI|nr:hypothetical protein BDY21DRAFT_367378 [Lineolata rhizophorae]
MPRLTNPRFSEFLEEDNFGDLGLSSPPISKNAPKIFGHRDIGEDAELLKSQSPECDLESEEEDDLLNLADQPDLPGSGKGLSEARKKPHSNANEFEDYPPPKSLVKITTDAMESTSDIEGGIGGGFANALGVAAGDLPSPPTDSSHKCSGVKVVVEIKRSIAEVLASDSADEASSPRGPKRTRVKTRVGSVVGRTERDKPELEEHDRHDIDQREPEIEAPLRRNELRFPRQKADVPSPNVLFSQTMWEKDFMRFIHFIPRNGGASKPVYDAEWMKYGNIFCVREDDIVRSPRLIFSLAAGRYIVTEKWIQNSYNAGYFLDPKKYLPEEHVLKVRSFKTTVEEASKVATRRPLKGLSIYITPKLSKEYRGEAAIVLDICKRAGASFVFNQGHSRISARQLHSGDWIAFVHDGVDFDGAQLIKRKGDVRCYHRDFLSLTVLRGKFVDDQGYRVTPFMDVWEKNSQRKKAPKL